MLPNMNLSQARTETIDADGYVMQIKNVGIDTKYNRLQLFLDISEGDKKGYYEKLNEKAGFWGMTLNLYLDDKNAWKFARAIDAIRESNDGFEWDDDGENDEHKLIGQYIGVVTRKREYLGNDGLVKRKLQPYSTLPVNDIREGNYTVPEPLPLQGNTPPSGEVVDTTVGFGPVSDDEMPF